MRKYPFGKGSVTLVSTEWLAEHLEDDDLMIIDVQPNIHDYVQEHIPGAIYLSEGLFRASKNGVPGYYIPADAVQSVLRRVGLRADVPVVVYTGKGAFKGWGDGLEQTMVAYSLARYGHGRIHVLDGGCDKWKKEGRRLVKEFPKAEKGDFTAAVNKEYYVEYDEFRKMKDRDDVILLDARPQEYYQGQGPWMKPGHIPGAVNLPWKSLMDPQNPRLLRPDNEVEETIAKSGATRDKTVVCSCGTGREATNEFLLFKWYLSYPKVRIYEGSFTEWTSYPDNPVVTGASPREKVGSAQR